ncbi:MAG: N-acetylglucosamine-6-phosphate deacetylase [Acidobacteria bacterium]|nr:N-acetylglucosamine-6-phosphate deacetylase [Acidobacteriota bacterium]
MSLLAIKAKQLFTPLRVIENGLLLVEDEAIRAVGTREDISVPKRTRILDLGDCVVAPGFVDIHIHGGGGHDVMEGSAEALHAVACTIFKHGTTTFLPTTVTASTPRLVRAVEGLGKLIRGWPEDKQSRRHCAHPLGIHLEGPFLSAARRGVHEREHLQAPSVELFEKFVGAAGGTLRVLTLAPELENAAELQAEAIRRGIHVALGHSDATFNQTERAIVAGASHVVHMFNAMRPFHQRQTGIMGAVLTDDRIAAEVIADGVHVAPSALRLLIRAKGVSKIILITDGVSATGMGQGQYRLGEADITVKTEGARGVLVCRNAEGKLAGSVLTQDRAVRNMVTYAGVNWCAAVKMATWNPARVLGIEDRKGCLRLGADADLVFLHPDGTVAGTMVRGVATCF